MKLEKDVEERFEKEKKKWELYGPLGMGIAYPKLKQFLASEIQTAVQKERIRLAKRIGQIGRNAVTDELLKELEFTTKDTKEVV